MTTVASIAWQRLDQPGHDRCRLVREPAGWMLCGHARFDDSGDVAALDYLVRCDRDWATTGADISGLIAGREVGWKIARDETGWSLNGARVGLQSCIDIDLGFTPATNLLPIRRLGLLAGGRADLSAAWFLPGAGGTLARLGQSYEAGENGQVIYRSDQFQASLRVDPSGFATRYGDLWEGQVDAGG